MCMSVCGISCDISDARRPAVGRLTFFSFPLMNTAVRVVFWAHIYCEQYKAIWLQNKHPVTKFTVIKTCIAKTKKKVICNKYFSLILSLKNIYFPLNKTKDELRQLPIKRFASVVR